jgi:hypothetical protein
MAGYLAALYQMMSFFELQILRTKQSCERIFELLKLKTENSKMYRDRLIVSAIYVLKVNRHVLK